MNCESCIELFVEFSLSSGPRVWFSVALGREVPEGDLMVSKNGKFMELECMAYSFWITVWYVMCRQEVPMAETHKEPNRSPYVST